MKKEYVLITPARNEEIYIEKTIQSVISQTVLPQKWVIVSDSSTDNTDEIVRTMNGIRIIMEEVDKNKELKELHDKTFQKIEKEEIARGGGAYFLVFSITFSAVLRELLPYLRSQVAVKSIEMIQKKFNVDEETAILYYKKIQEMNKTGSLEGLISSLKGLF